MALVFKLILITVLYFSDDDDRLRIAENGSQNSDTLETATQGEPSQSQASQGSVSQSQEPESQPLIFSPSSDEEEGIVLLIIFLMYIILDCRKA